MVFLAFSNSEIAPLPTLSREFESVASTLADGYLNNRYQFFADPIATPERLLRQLKQFRNHLTIFLYSGHAGRDGLLLQHETALADGIALELQHCAATLKLVVLNGCSTAGQVQRLIDLGVPVVIATHAPVGDKAATEFSIRFFENLAAQQSIRQAFQDALGPAKTFQPGIGETETLIRSIGPAQAPEADIPLWGLFYREDFANLLDANPLYIDAPESATDYEPNKRLVDTLCNETLREHPNLRALELRAESGELVEQSDREIAIVNALPYPVGEHLRKLFCLVEGDDEGYDKAGPKRLAQIALTYHVSVELLGFVMLAQLWEILLDREDLQVPQDLREALIQYFQLPSEARGRYGYIGLIRQIRRFMDSLEGFTYFVDELQQLGAQLADDHRFAQACQYLHLLHARPQSTAGDMNLRCRQAEEHLSHFFAELGFLSKYALISIQDIDVQKYRHSRAATFSHELVRLMRAMGKNEISYYLLQRHLDNRGLLLIKGPVRPTARPGGARNEFVADQLEYLNISPFLIDRNAFEDNADLTHLYSFDTYLAGNGEYWFKPVKKPADPKLVLTRQPEFEAVRLQLEAFRRRVLGERFD